MAQRLVLIGAGVTAETRSLVFGDRSDLLRPEGIEPIGHRVAGWASGPEPAAVQSARRLGGTAEVAAPLAGPDFGRWQGQTLLEVGDRDPDGLRQWLCDATAAPHQGESLAMLIERVGAYCDSRAWPEGRSVIVVTPLVARAVAVHALGAAADVIFRIDVAPLGRVGLSRHGSGWRLQQLG